MPFGKHWLKLVNSSCLKGGFCKTEKTHSATAPFWTIVLLRGLHDGFLVVRPFKASLKAQTQSQALGVPSLHDFYRAKHGLAFWRRTNFIQICVSLLALIGFGRCFHQQRVNFCRWAHAPKTRRAPPSKASRKNDPIALYRFGYWSTSRHLEKLVEFRPRLHCTYDVFRLLNIKSELRTNWNLFVLLKSVTIKIGSTHWWSQSWTRLTEHNPLGAKDWGCWIWHCEVVSCLTETREVANLRCSLQFCQRLACEYLKSGPIFLRTVRPCCFNVWPHCKCSPSSRRLPANVLWLGLWIWLHRCSWGRGPTCFASFRQAALW